MLRRRCGYELPGGRPCGAPPGRGSAFCFWHDPDRADDLAEAQRLGGMRRRRERTVAGAYDYMGLGSVAAIRRILDIAVLDVVGLENSIARARVLISAALAASKLLEVGEIEDRLAALEASRPPAGMSADLDPEL